METKKQSHSRTYGLSTPSSDHYRVKHRMQDSVSSSWWIPTANTTRKQLTGSDHSVKVVSLCVETSLQYCLDINFCLQIANIDHKEGSLLHLRLIDPQDPAVSQDPQACINADLLREGVALIDRKGCKYLSAYPQLVKKLQESVLGAKRERLGMFEFGDVEED